MKCSNCGTILKNNYSFCPECGHKFHSQDSSSNISFGWGILGFFVPLAGLILFILWSSTRKKDARAAGVGALIGAVLNILLVIIYIIFILAVTKAAIGSTI